MRIIRVILPYFTGDKPGILILGSVDENVAVTIRIAGINDKNVTSGTDWAESFRLNIAKTLY